MDPLEKIFDDNRREQQHYVKTAQIQKNLRETTETALKVLSDIAARGKSMDEQEEQSRLIMESSENMAQQAEEVRGMQKWRWWWCWCCKSTPQSLSSPPENKRRIFRFSK
jgi:hypothetical protein